MTEIDILKNPIYQTIFSILSKDDEIQIRSKKTDIPDIWIFLSLAITKIVMDKIKEKIIKVLKDYYFEDEEDIKLFEQIASEILEEE